MNIAIILISVLAPLIIVAIFGYSVFNWRKNAIAKDKYQKGNTIVWKFDEKTRRFISYNILGEPVTNLKMIESGTWVPVSYLTDNYPEHVQKMFREAFDQLDRGVESTSFKFDEKSIVHKDHMTYIEFSWNKADDGTGYFMRAHWMARPIKKSHHIMHTNLLTKEQVAEHPSPWKGFIAFNIHNRGNYYSERLIEVIEKMFKFRSISFFYSAGYLVFVVFESSASRAKKRVGRFNKLFLKAGYKKGGTQLFEGSAYLMSSKADTVKAVNKVMQTLDYLISISIETKTNFLTWNKDMDKNEFETFVDASKSFRQSVRTKTIESQVMTVKNWKTGRKTIEYRYPNLSSINQKLLSRILRNQNNTDYVINAHADANLLEKNLDKPCLVDITIGWLLEHQNDLTNKNIIYVVRLDYNKDFELVQTTMKRLEDEGFVFALKIYAYSEAVTTLIQAVNPGFIVVSRTVWDEEGVLNSDRMFELMTINKLAHKYKIKMIYQQPSKIIDPHTAEKIGLQFYFDVEQ